MRVFRGAILGVFAIAAFWAGQALAGDITVYSSAALAVGQSRQLTAYVPLTPNTVNWSVNGVQGGSATYGTVSATGLYQAPTTLPANTAVTVAATSTASSAKSGSVTITLTQNPVQLWSVSPTSVGAGPFTISLNGAAFTANSIVYIGDTAVTTTFVSSTGLKAAGTATVAQVGTKLGVKVVNPGLGGTTSSSVSLGIKMAASTPMPTPTPTPTPTPMPMPTPTPTPSPTDPSTPPTSSPPSTSTGPLPVVVGSSLGTPHLAAARLLEQATFGPTPATIAHLEQIGVNAWLAEQFNTAETPIVDPGGMLSNALQQQYLSRLSTAPDQLRQRVAYALSQIIVISMNKNIYPDEVVPYLQILSGNAFGNYRTLLGQIATSAQMGKYLDLANSNKPNAGSGANENFAREMMQLFTIGLTMLNADGTPQLDAQGNTIPTYDQTTVQQVALAVTGWTYQGPNANNFENFVGPMQPEDVNHDMRQKTFLGCTLPPSQTTVQDMNATLDCVFKHPNVGPFVATRLIRSLVTSNPSPAYIGRVAAVFADNGSGVRGDLQAVVKAILTDTEARNDVAPVTSGRLKDPILNVIAFVRAMGGSIAPANGLPWQFGLEDETPLTAPSVFSFYSPTYRIPKSSLYGPEFQIYTPTESVMRGNFFWQILSNPGSDFTVDLSSFVAASGDTVKTIDAVDQALLYGRMPQAMRQSLGNAMAVQGDNLSRMRAAIYLTALSGFYAVQY